MRTKTLLLSALLGTLGSVSVMAQTNVYSINAVGYINLTIYPGFNIISCPLIGSPDNTENTLLNNSTGIYNQNFLYYYNPATGGFASVQGRTAGTSGTGWTDLGTNTLNPGTAAWFDNLSGTNITVTFVGTVPTGPFTNNLGLGFNLVGSVVPMSGDIYSNTLSMQTNVAPGDTVYVFNPQTQAYTTYGPAKKGIIAGNGGSPWPLGNGAVGDPIIPSVGQGFWYDNGGQNGVEAWVEDYIVQ
jgi:hypothetical protein